MNKEKLAKQYFSVGSFIRTMNMRLLFIGILIFLSHKNISYQNIVLNIAV